MQLAGATQPDADPTSHIPGRKFYSIFSAACGGRAFRVVGIGTTLLAFYKHFVNVHLLAFYGKRPRLLAYPDPMPLDRVSLPSGSRRGRWRQWRATRVFLHATSTVHVHCTAVMLEVRARSGDLSPPLCDTPPPLCDTP